MQATGRLPTGLLVFAHGSVDIYQGMVPVRVPFLVSDRHYSYVQAACSLQLREPAPLETARAYST